MTPVLVVRFQGSSGKERIGPCAAEEGQSTTRGSSD